MSCGYTKYRDFFNGPGSVFGGGIPTGCNNCRYHPNVVKDYFTLEGTTDVGTITLRNSVDVKRVRIDNSTPFDVAVLIVPYRYSPTENPEPQFILNAGSSRYLGVNQPGENLQFIHLFDVKTKKLINTPHPLDYHSNQFVIYSGGYEDCLSYCEPSGERYQWMWIKSFRMTFN